jgi:acyl carrier protein
MSDITEQETLGRLIELIKEVKPSLADATIKPEDTLTEKLGLDSLDILQLVRKVRRNMGGEFDLDSWSANKAVHRGSIQSIVDAISSPVAS